MNWEVNSMQLKTSFFNPTLFWKNLTRSWPLWGGITVLGSLVPLFLMLSSIGTNMQLYKDDFADLLYNAAVYFVPWFTFVYALLVAMFVWNYLHNNRAVGMMHSLAVNRTCLFVTSTLSGLAMLLIPYVVVGALLCLFAASFGALSVGTVLVTVLTVLLDNLLFFGMATLCAHVGGNLIAMVVYYIILNFAVPVLDLLITSLAGNFLFGFNDTVSGFSVWFAPLVSLLEKVEVSYLYDELMPHNDMPTIENYWLIVVYGAVGIAMLALSWLLYRIRRSESAGDVVAYSWLRPVFRFGVSIVSSLTLGRALYEMFWVALVSSRPSAVAVIIYMTIGAVVGYYIAAMLLDKTLRVFKGSLKNVGIVVAVTVALCLGVSLDIFGIERYVPDSGDVRRVTVSGALDFTCDAEKMPELTEDILALHEDIIADKAYVESMEEGRVYSDNGEFSWRTLHFEYTLKNGSTVERYYYLPLSRERVQDGDTYDAKLFALSTDPRMLIASVSMPDDGRFSYAQLEYYVNEDGGIWNSNAIEQEQFEIIYAALLRDAAEGNFTMENTGWADAEKYGEDEYLRATLWYEYRLNETNGVRDYYNIYLDLQPTMVHTLRALAATNMVPRTVVEGWLKQAK